MSPALAALLVFLISFAVVTVLFRMPVSFALGTSSLFVLAYSGFRLVTVPQFAFSGLDSFALLAIPFYIFAGVLMEYSGISKMLIDWVKSFVGRVRGATGIITTCACMAFGVLTGSAMATISAIGKMMVPELEKEHYPRGYISALLAATCFLGILIPPSVPGIMYALASGAKITPVWMSTVGPAFIFMLGYFLVNYMRISRHQPKPEIVRISLGKKAVEIVRSTVFAMPALLMPIIIYGSIYGGLCTVTEAGAISCVYGIFYFFVLKIIDKKRVPITFWRCCAIAGAATAVIGLLNAFSAVAGKVMTLAGISNYLSGIITSNITTQGGFLLMINIIFLFMGTFMDINATILIMTPLLLPVATKYAIDPIHFGAIMLVNMCVGFLTPPFAVGVFVSCKIADATFGDTVREAVPFILVGLVAIIVTTLCPGYIHFFVNLFC